MRISLSFDVEPDLHSGEFIGITEGIPRILSILDKHKVKATFFTTSDCIENYPKIFQNLKKNGHEIASHGYRHVRFDDLNLEQKEESIKKSIHVFKKYLNQHPMGFRAAQHSVDINTSKILSHHGFKYDSSKTPLNLLQVAFFPKRIKSNLLNFCSNPRKHKSHNLIEIPTSSLGLPFVSILPRVFPKSAQKIYFKLLELIYKDAVFYAHSWDFISLPRSKIDRNFPHNRVIENFDFMVGYLKKKHDFVKMNELIN
ncbi:polysaccharide deacetylase family protein [Candidatus Pacearchaeota archaeon]|nr:polysaccharide deacetylase family protein [Candidatus Pacearchaeota archaeon]